MTIEQTLGDILDETVEAFSHLDSTRLHSLEQRMVVIAASNVKFESRTLPPGFCRSIVSLKSSCRTVK